MARRLLSRRRAKPRQTPWPRSSGASRPTSASATLWPRSRGDSAAAKSSTTVVTEKNGGHVSSVVEVFVLRPASFFRTSRASEMPREQLRYACSNAFGVKSSNALFGHGTREGRQVLGARRRDRQ